MGAFRSFTPSRFKRAETVFRLISNWAPSSLAVNAGLVTRHDRLNIFRAEVPLEVAHGGAGLATSVKGSALRLSANVQAKV
jgi:hypothetical protein